MIKVIRQFPYRTSFPSRPMRRRNNRFTDEALGALFVFWLYLISAFGLTFWWVMNQFR